MLWLTLFSREDNSLRIEIIIGSNIRLSPPSSEGTTAELPALHSISDAANDNI